MYGFFLLSKNICHNKRSSHTVSPAASGIYSNS